MSSTVDYGKLARSVTLEIKAWLDGIEMSQLPQPQVPFRWAGKGYQALPDILAEKWGHTRRWWLEFLGNEQAGRLHSYRQFAPRMALIINYGAGASSPIQEISELCFADSMAIYDELNVATKWSGFDGVLEAVVAAPGTTIKIPGEAPGVIASIEHRIPVQVKLRAK